MMKQQAQALASLEARPSAISTGSGPRPDSAKTTRASPKRLLLSTLEWFGGIGEFCVRLVKAAVTPPYEGRELLRQMDEVGAKSLPLVALAGAAIGGVLSLHTRDSMAQFGAKSLLPQVIILSLVKETGPIITALVVSGRVGAGIGAELGSMKVTEQIDAIEASAVNPYKFLAATRVVACMLMLPLLTMVAPECVLAPVRYSPAIGVRYCDSSGRGRNMNIWSRDMSICMMLPLRRPTLRSRSSGDWMYL